LRTMSRERVCVLYARLEKCCFVFDNCLVNVFGFHCLFGHLSTISCNRVRHSPSTHSRRVTGLPRCSLASCNQWVRSNYTLLAHTNKLAWVQVATYVDHAAVTPAPPASHYDTHGATLLHVSHPHASSCWPLTSRRSCCCCCARCLAPSAHLSKYRPKVNPSVCAAVPQLCY
jgi:hypothetical protein